MSANLRPINAAARKLVHDKRLVDVPGYDRRPDATEVTERARDISRLVRSCEYLAAALVNHSYYMAQHPDDAGVKHLLHQIIVHQPDLAAERRDQVRQEVLSGEHDDDASDDEAARL